MSDRRTQILDLTETLIRSKGYNAFSYKDISVPLDIKNAAVHYHFPSKGDLGLALLERTRTRFQQKIEKWEKLSPRNRLKAFIGIYHEGRSRNLVCIMGALGPSCHTLPAAMQEALAATSTDLRQYLRATLQLGKDQGDFNFPEEVKAKADIIAGSLLSSSILERVTGENVLKVVEKGILDSV